MTTRPFTAAVALAVMLVSACDPPSPAQGDTFPPLLNIVIVDQSASFKYADYSANDLGRLLQEDAQEYETWVAIVSVLEEKSIEQPLALFGPLLLDTLPEKEYSIYQLPEVQHRNQQAKEAFSKQLSELLSAYSAVNSKNDRKYSDINGALKYAQRLAQQQQYANATIRVIILSDFDHDLPGDSQLGSFEFPANAEVYPVGLNRDLDFDKVFPVNRVELLVGLRSEFFTYSR